MQKYDDYYLLFCFFAVKAYFLKKNTLIYELKSS